MNSKGLFLRLVAIFTVTMFASRPFSVLADDLLVDLNEDGQIVVLAFGDSITYGVGDGTEPGVEVETVPFTTGRAGYPARIEQISGHLVDNEGVPGEAFVSAGFGRFPALASSTRADAIVFYEGANDATEMAGSGSYAVLLQRIANVSHALGKPLVIATLPPSCCNHGGRGPFLSSYNAAIREISSTNNLRLADLELSWSTTCSQLPECELLNLPEGLHPNSKGYDVIAQTVLASLADINIFAASGAAELEQRFGISPDKVVVKPIEQEAEPDAENA